MTTLIVTNGDMAGSTLKEIYPEARILPWRDVLHDGPVVATETDEAFRKQRATFLQSFLPSGATSPLADLEERDLLIQNHSDFDRIELWLEHDLYDQLQALHVLHLLSEHGRRHDVWMLITEQHLGPLHREQLADMAESLLPVAPATFEAATVIWEAVRRPTPKAIDEVLVSPTPGLPYVKAAIKRFLQELPGSADGLSRTERQILYSIDRGVSRTGMLFARVLAMEEAAFLGDVVFFTILSRLATAKVPLIDGLSEPFEPDILEDTARRKAFIQSNVRLTQKGAEVLAGTTDHVTLNGIDRWLGGCHLTSDHVWRYDMETDKIGEPGGC